LCIDIPRLLRLAVAGALAGLFIYLIFNPAYAREEQLGRDFIFGADIAEGMMSALVRAFLSTLVLNGAFSVMLGGMLVLADEYNSAPKRVAIRMGMVTASGAAAGAIAGVLAQFLYMMINLFTLGLGQIVARGIGWAVMGAGAGVCVGWVLGGFKRAKMSTLGGFIGGLAGGLVFDLIGTFSQTGSASRFVGFVLIGLLTGAAVALVEDIAKQNWVTILSGPKEGRSYILTRPITTIGRDEMADIALFADPSVAKDHARLLLHDADVMIQSASNTTVTVNGAQTQYAQLRPWDVIGVGRWSLRFHQKASRQQMAYVAPLPDLTSAKYRPTYSPVNRTISQPAVVAATGQLSLVVTAGPHLNQRFSFGPGTVRIGREVGCGVVLAQDSVVSRSHAELTWTGTNWMIRDLQSRNGLWVNGVRVTEHVLVVGDQIGVGQSWLQVEAI
jgi:pSer/pThr/pTyr-binding forkhead associated (FHA) protein